MYIGRFDSALGTDNRVLIPFPFRADSVQGLFATRGFDRNLIILPGGAFEQVYRRASSLNMADPLARLLMRLILGSARELQVDAAGEITLPEELKAYAQLQRNVSIIGQGDYFEIWAPELWSNQESQLGDAMTNSTRFAPLVVATR